MGACSRELRCADNARASPVPSRHIPPEAERRGIPPVTTRANRDLARKNPSTTQDPRTRGPHNHQHHATERPQLTAHIPADTRPSAEAHRHTAQSPSGSGPPVRMTRHSRALSYSHHPLPAIASWRLESSALSRSPHHRGQRERPSPHAQRCLCRTRAARALYVRHTPDRSPWVHPPPEQHTTQTEALSPDPDVHTTRRHTQATTHADAAVPSCQAPPRKRRVGLHTPYARARQGTGRRGGNVDPRTQPPRNHKAASSDDGLERTVH